MGRLAKQQLPAGAAKVCALLLFASVLYIALLSISIGDYDFVALLAAVVVIGVTFVAAFVRPIGTSRSFGWISVAVLILLAAQSVIAWRLPGANLLRYWSYGEQALIGLTLVGVAGAIAIGLVLSRSGWQRIAVGALALAAVAQFSVAAYLIGKSEPEIDVWYFHHEAITAFSKGTNPYAITFTNMHNNNGRDDSPLYSREVQKNGRLLFGYPYPPLSLLMTWPSEMLTQDARYGLTAYYLLAAVLLATLNRGGVSIAAAAVLMLAPCAWLVFRDAWTEPQIILAIAFVAWCGIKKPAWLAAAIGLFLSLKQYSVIFLPLLLVILPRPLTTKTSAKFLAILFGTMALVSLPIALWDWPAFWRSNVYIQMIQPFRYDSLSFLALYARTLPPGATPPSPIIAAIVLLPVEALLVWRLPRNIAGFALGVAVTMIVFLFLNRQAFLNYHIFAASALVIAAACFEGVYAVEEDVAS